MENQELYDEAMFDFSRGDFNTAAAKFEQILASHPEHFDAILSLGMTHYRMGDFARAISEGHRAERLRPQEQLVHTNLSLFYMKSGNKITAEHHGLQARIASWRGNMDAPAPAPGSTIPQDSELVIQTNRPTPIKLPEKFPDMPWKKQKTIHPTPTPPEPMNPARSSPDV